MRAACHLHGATQSARLLLPHVGAGVLSRYAAIQTLGCDGISAAFDTCAWGRFLAWRRLIPFIQQPEDFQASSFIENFSPLRRLIGCSVIIASLSSFVIWFSRLPAISFSASTKSSKLVSHTTIFHYFLAIIDWRMRYRPGCQQMDAWRPMPPRAAPPITHR